MKIGVVGAGLVGHTVATGLRLHGHTVYENDIDPEKSEFSKAEIMRECHCVFICVNTPYHRHRMDLRNVYRAVEEFSAIRIMTRIHDPPILFVKSTVMPGTCHDLTRLYPRFTVVSNPEFLRATTALEDYLHPDRIVIGTNDIELAGRYYNYLFHDLVDLDHYYIVPPTAAELIKLFSNALLTTKVAFANLVEAVGRFHGYNNDYLMQIITADHRFNPDHLTPSLGKIPQNSMCLPKDLLGLRDYLINNDIDAELLTQVYNWGVES